MFYFHVPITASLMQNMLRKPYQGEVSHLLKTRNAWASWLDGDSTTAFSAAVPLLCPHSTAMSESQGGNVFGKYILDTSTFLLFFLHATHTHTHTQEALECMFPPQQSYLHNYV